MRVEFIVSSGLTGWTVKRGRTSALSYDSQDRAVTAAENLARAATGGGDIAVVKVMADGLVQETRTFQPEGLRPLPRRSAPDLDDRGVRRGRTLGSFIEY